MSRPTKSLNNFLAHNNARILKDYVYVYVMYNMYDVYVYIIHEKTLTLFSRNHNDVKNDVQNLYNKRYKTLSFYYDVLL